MTRFSTLAALLAGLLLGALVAVTARSVVTSRGVESAQTQGRGHRLADAQTERATPVLEAIRQRRTVRAYKPDPVPEADVMTILDAARLAPTAGNQQPWKFLVVRDRGRLDLLREQAIEWYMERVRRSPDAAGQDLESIRSSAQGYLRDALSAPVYVAVLADREARYPDYIIQDGTLAAGNLMIAARALGYGTGFFTSFFPEEQMRGFLNIPDNYALICFTPIGVPAEWPAMPEKKELSELVVFDSF